MKYSLLERKDLEGNNIVAYSPEVSPKLEKRYNIAGSIENSGLTSADFRYHDHWGFDYIEIQPVGSLKKPSEKIKLEVERVLETAFDETFDGESLSQSQEVKRLVLGHQKINGDLYLARFTISGGRGKEIFEGKNMCKFYIVNPLEGRLSLEENHLLLNQAEIELTEDLQYVVNSDMYQGNFTLQKVGSINVHRKSLQPSISYGRFGSPHQNNACVILREKKFEDFELK